MNTKSRYKIDLSEPTSYYLFSLFKRENNKWKWVESSNSISDLEEIIKSDQIFPLYYE